MKNRLQVLKMGNERGTVFVTTMVTLLIMVLTGTYFFNMSSHGMAYVKRIEHSTQAKYLADAALARIYSTVTAATPTGASFSNQSLGLGTYTASISVVSGRYLAAGTGNVLGVSRGATSEVIPPSISALSYAIATGGNASLDAGTSSSNLTVNGDIYGAGNVSLDGAVSGGATTINGNVQAGGTATNSGTVTVTGTETSSYSSTVSFPTPDYSYYQAIAAANSYYYSTNKTFDATTPLPATPAGGVIYVAGDVIIHGTQTTTACIVATGNVNIDKDGSAYPKVTVNQFSTYPAFIVTGNFTYSTTGNGDGYLTATGLVYVNGNFTYTAANHDNLSITGSLLARGNITMSPTAQNTSVVTYVAQNPARFSNPSVSLTIASYNT